MSRKFRPMSIIYFPEIDEVILVWYHSWFGGAVESNISANWNWTMYHRKIGEL